MSCSPQPIPAAPRSSSAPGTGPSARGTSTPTRSSCPAPEELRHEFHDTRHRRVHYRARAASRFREYFPPEDPGDFTRIGDAIEVDVPASAPPAAPVARYAVPTFAWEREEDTNIRVSRRLGNAIRVYLDRPWFSSGEGEQLGVVVWASLLETQLTPQVGRYVTQAGRDPTTKTEPVFEFSSLYPRATQVLRVDSVPEISAPGPIHVVCHDVEFDAERDAWSCDIEFDNSPTFRPFVRLALARVQPHAVPHAQVSPITLLDWAQLWPDRSVVLTHDPEVPGRVTVTVAGRTYEALAETPTGSRVALTLQEHDGRLPPDFDWVAVEPFDLGEPDTSNGPDLLWRSTFDLPASPDRGPFRLLVEELEDLPSDDGGAARSTYFDIVPIPDGSPMAATGGELDFAHWTEAQAHGTRAAGLLHGQAITLEGTLGTAFYLHDDYPNFDTPAFTPPLPATGMIEIVGQPGQTFTIRLGAPLCDPVLHLGSLASKLSLPPGTPVTRLSGDPHFIVADATVTGAAQNAAIIDGTLGPTDSNGSIQLAGVFTTITFTLIPTFTGGAGTDGVFIQVGGRAS